MSWARLMVPLAGTPDDMALVEAAATVCAAFDAELLGVHTPADFADVMPWMGEGFMGGMNVAVVDSIKQAAAEGEKIARKAMESCSYARKRLVALQSPVWAELAMQGRLSDVVAFDNGAARGRGPLAEAFQQLVADEQRPTLVLRPGLDVAGVMAVAWDGGKEASRSVRTALPLLQKASKVVLLAAPEATSRDFDPEDLAHFLSVRGVKAEVSTLSGHGDVAQMLLTGAREAGATLLVAGAFGHPRLQEYIFGGTTRSLLNSDGPSLFLSH
jgi:nucleotide-binding universal stress UspA family protein